jgi:hypothetical protein
MSNRCVTTGQIGGAIIISPAVTGVVTAMIGVETVTIGVIGQSDAIIGVGATIAGTIAMVMVTWVAAEEAISNDRQRSWPEMN